MFHERTFKCDRLRATLHIRFEQRSLNLEIRGIEDALSNLRNEIHRLSIEPSYDRDRTFRNGIDVWSKLRRGSRQIRALRGQISARQFRSLQRQYESVMQDMMRDVFGFNDAEIDRFFKEVHDTGPA